GRRLATMWYNKNTKVISREFTKIAKSIPKGVEYQIHQVVIEFQIKNVIYAVINTFLFFLDVLELRIFFSANNRGTNPTNTSKASPYVGHDNPKSTPDSKARMILFFLETIYNSNILIIIETI